MAQSDWLITIDSLFCARVGGVEPPFFSPGAISMENNGKFWNRKLRENKLKFHFSLHKLSGKRFIKRVK